MKKEAAAEVEGEGEVDVFVMGAGSPGWLELLSLQGIRVLLLLSVMVLTGASEAVTFLSASANKPWTC